MSSESRRKLLKSIAAGSGAIVACKSLPDSWSRPVVDSVMLPAHAETSPTDEQTSCPGLIISGVTNTCANNQSNITTYEIDDSGACPVITTGAPIYSAESVIAIERRALGAGPLVIVWPGLQTSISIQQYCSNPDPDASVPEQISIPSTTGAPWIGTFVMTRAADQVSMGNITLVPA